MGRLDKIVVAVVIHFSFQSVNDGSVDFDFNPYPASPSALADRKGRAASPKGVQNHVSDLCYLNHAFEEPLYSTHWQTAFADLNFL